MYGQKTVKLLIGQLGRLWDLPPNTPNTWYQASRSSILAINAPLSWVWLGQTRGQVRSLGIPMGVSYSTQAIILARHNINNNSARK